MELIDIRKVLEKKSPKHAARIPRFVTNWLARLIHQRELNELLIYGDGLKNVDDDADQVLIAGMGGEEIISILLNSPFLPEMLKILIFYASFIDLLFAYTWYNI